MNFSISSNDLQKVLGNIGGVIPSKSTLPILENFLFEAQKDQLRLTATDLDISMSVDIPLKVIKEGKIAVPAKRLFETVRSLPSTEMTFIAEPNNNKITISTSNGEYKLTGESVENFPTISTFKSIEEIKISENILRRLISKTLFAVSTDELRPAMMGVLFQFRKTEIRVAATDGHRLVRFVNSSFSSGKKDIDLIIPAKALNLVLKSIGDGECTISLNEESIMFTFNKTTLISRLISEKYPNYESVIPLDNDKTLVIDKNQLISSVRRTSLYASLTTHQIRFALKKGNLTVSAEDIDLGSEAKEMLSCDYSSEPMEIGFNSNYITDLLTHIDTDEATFSMGSSTRAAIVKPVTQHNGENLLMLVMPVRLNV
ncbi:MAG TPA: DNA polymerase III subunit beta [Bacteroidota bacterium]|nr:DNA polymerase III subunit beta [Bacteroidota bacterium]